MFDTVGLDLKIHLTLVNDTRLRNGGWTVVCVAEDKKVSLKRVSCRNCKTKHRGEEQGRDPPVAEGWAGAENRNVMRTTDKPTDQPTRQVLESRVRDYYLEQKYGNTLRLYLSI